MSNETEAMRIVLAGKLEEVAALQRLGDELADALQDLLDSPSDDDVITRATMAMRQWEHGT